MYGEKLHKIRTTLKLSQEQIASQVGISYRAYTSYERGDRKPSLEFLKQIADIFNVNLNWLIADKENMFIQENKLSLKEEILLDVKSMLRQEGLIK